MIDRSDTATPYVPDRPSLRRRRGEPPPRRRPRLTSHRLAKFARGVFNDRRETEWRDLAARDWRAFIGSAFKLDDAQREALFAIDGEAVASIGAAVREMIEKGGQLEAVLPDGRKGGEVTFSRIDPNEKTDAARTTKGSAARRINIPILKCSFDANCRNWKCKPG